MRFRSSIFSSETLRLRGWRPTGLLFALLFLAVFEIAVARQPWVWSYVPRSESGVIDALESRVIEPAPAPRVVLLGNSRLRDAVLPRRLEERLSLPRGTVLNLGLTDGEPYDYLTLYTRNRAKLSKAERLVVAVDDFRFNEKLGPGERFRRYAGLSERIGAYEGKTASLVVGWLWRTFDASHAIRRTFETILVRGSRGFPIAEDGRVAWRDEEADAGPETIDADAETRIRYGVFEPSERRVDPLRRLLAEAAADGVAVTLIQLPSRDAIVEATDRLAPGAPAFHAEVFARLAEEFPGTRVRIYRRASDLGIPDTWFYDYGHLTRPGADVFTDDLADRLAEHGPPKR